MIIYIVDSLLYEYDIICEYFCCIVSKGDFGIVYKDVRVKFFVFEFVILVYYIVVGYDVFLFED